MTGAPLNALPALATIDELAAYLDQPTASVAARCRDAARVLAERWRAEDPATPAAVGAFYRDHDDYLFDLTEWHGLNADDSALIQWRALEAAMAHRARAALDFGSGIGSLGLLLAEQGIAVTLADVNARLNDYARWRFARRGLPVQFVAPTALPAAAFDFISAVDVLEHLPDVWEILPSLAAALRAGGTLFIHMPGAGAAHPMHFPHDPARVLGELQARGLWLEHAAGAAWILRRGEPARYRLQPGLELIPDERADGGLLFSLRPLLAMRLNTTAFGLVSSLAEERSAAEAAAWLPASFPLDATAFLDSLAQRRLLTKTPPVTGHWPRVSVIVPARGRPAATRACVESLLALDYSADRLEILVVDDASEPPLIDALRGLSVRLLRLDHNIGQAAARNWAAAEARGEVLAFIDNDCVAESDWLRKLVPYLDDPAVGIVGGRVVAPRPNGWVAAFEAARSPLDMGVVGGAVGPAETVAYLPTCNLLARRDVVLSQAGFTAAMRVGEDVDFIWRALRTGARAVYAPAGRIVHHHRERLSALLRRRADYGSSEADLQRRHPAGRRVMRLPRVGLLGLAALTAVMVAWPVGLALGVWALGRMAREFMAKRRRLCEFGVVLTAARVAGAVLREHGAALYHFSANILRYYSLPLLAVVLLWRPLVPAAAVLALTAPLIDYRRLRPALPWPVFVGLYWLELAAYQVGVWRGCLRWRTPRPLLPIIQWGK